MERIQTISMDIFDTTNTIREALKYLTFQEAAIDNMSVQLDELKASMYLELVDNLKNLATQERDYFTEKSIPEFKGMIKKPSRKPIICYSALILALETGK